MIRLPKGAKPVSVALSPWQEFAWRTFGGFVQAHYKEDQDLEDNLLQAHIKLRPEEYLAVAWLNTTIAAVGAVVGALFVSLFLLVLRASILYLVLGFALVAILPGLFAYMGYFGLPVGYHGKPASLAKKR